MCNRTIGRRLAIITVVLFSSAVLKAESIVVVGWNVESGGADADVLSQRIATMNGVDLWGFSEVQNDTWANKFEVAAEDGENANFARITGSTGGADRLAIVYDADRFQFIDKTELTNININNSVRAPLVLHLRIKSNGQEFLFMVNHLYRSNNEGRHLQGELLNQWAAQQENPVIAVGDYNFDWSVSNGESDHDLGYDNMTKDGVFKWIRPTTLVRTNWSSFPPSVLDFVFVAQGGTTLTASSEILVVPNDFPDNGQTSDHRPMLAQITWTTGPTPEPTTTRQQLLEHIGRIEADLAAIKALAMELNE